MKGQVYGLNYQLLEAATFVGVNVYLIRKFDRNRNENEYSAGSGNANVNC